MSEETVLKPDIGFIKSLKSAGAETMKKCYQCATCSVVCQISPDENPFPRKEMIMAQWGMKDDIAKDPDIWLCHNCNDCSKYCPRGAAPGDVLSAMRKMAIHENATPQFLAKLLGEPKLVVVALIIPIVIFLIALLIEHGTIFLIPPDLPNGQVVFSALFPIHLVDSMFVPIAMLVAVSFVFSVMKFWKNLNREPYKLMVSGSLVPSLIATLKEIFQHKKFDKCDANKDRTWAHRLVFFGFIGLFITTNWAVFNLYGLSWPSPYLLEQAPELFGSPAVAGLYKGAFKLFGNISAIALLIGAILMFSNRLKDRGFTSLTSSFDWVLAFMVLAVCVTGILSEVLRVANSASLAYPMYFAHLVFVFYIIAYLPFSKLAHLVYRTTAITYAKMAKRDVE